MDEQFRRAEDEFIRLKGQLAIGRIRRELFESALKTLMIQDAQGRYWTLHPDSGKWLVYVGQAWREANPNPPIPSAPPTSLPEREPESANSKSTPAALPSPTVPVQSARGYTPAPPPVDLPGVVSFHPAQQLPMRSASRTPLHIALIVGTLIAALVMCVVAIAIARPSDSVAQATPPARPAASLTLSPVDLVSSASSTPAPSNSVTPPLLSRAEFLSSADALARSIAELNRAELKYIKDARASASTYSPPRVAVLWLSPPPAVDTALLDGDLREIGARALIVGETARTMSEKVGVHDGASQAAMNISSQFQSVARIGYALVIEVQNIRDDLREGNYRLDTSASRIAGYGARLWNPAVVERTASTPENPFTRNVTDNSRIAEPQFAGAAIASAFQAQLGNIQLWLASSPQLSIQSVTVPTGPAIADNPADRNLVANLTSAAGQLDGDAARRFALAQLDRSPGQTSQSGNMQITLPAAVAVSDSSAASASALPYFDGGTATTVSKENAGTDDPALVTLLSIPAGSPVVVSRVPIDDKSDYPVVLTLSLKQITKTHPGDARPFTVQVFLTYVAPYLVSPRFLISCVGADPREVTVTNNSGSVTFATRQSVGYGTIDCAALGPDQSGLHLLGSSYLPVDVGSPQEMTDAAKTRDSRWNDIDKTREASYTELIRSVQRTMTQEAIDGTSTQAAKKQQQAVGTQVAGQKTAEFRATTTEIARRTAAASAANVFTLNGVHSITQTGAEGFVVRTSGLIKLTVDANTGKVNGTLSGSGGWSIASACVVSQRTGRWNYDLILTGQIDPKTGALRVDTTGTTTMTSDFGVCYCLENRCEKPGPTDSFSARWILDGTVDLKNRTGNGRLNAPLCTGQCRFEGDWSAGQ